jgi:integrase
VTWPAAAAGQPSPAAGVYVLHGRPLRPGALLEQTPTMSDDIWLLNAAILQLHVSSRRLNFLSVPAQYRAAAKTLVYAMLSGRLPDGEQRRSISTIKSVFGELQRFLTWLDSQNTTASRLGLASITTADLAGYQRHLIAVGLPLRGRAFAQSSTGYLWRYRHALPPADQLRFDPRLDASLHKPQPRAPENSTGRIPEAVLGPLLAWSMRFTTDFAPDVLACCRQWRADRISRAGFRGQVTVAQARQLLADRAARRQPLPGRNGKVNILALAKTLGCSRHVLADLATEIGQAAAAAGITPWACYEVPITGRLDGEPWISGIATHHFSPGSLDELARLLQAACYVIIAFLSGMRDSEVKHLRRGCLAISRDADQRPYRWKITSLAFKGERDPAGTPATWVVGEPVAQAIKVLEKLQPPGTDLLFTQLPYGPGAGPAQRGPNQVPRTATTTRQLNELAAWISGYCRQHGRCDAITPVNGQPFRLQTRQFRRTLAWFIARQPGGVIAGAIQYRHLSIQMFEGYAGTSDSGFRAEVEAEQALARGEHLLAMIDKHDHECLTGPAARQAAQRLADFGRRARFRGIAITDNRQLARLMQRDDPAVYPGTYATCIYNPDKALCRQQHDTRGTLRPALGSCQPLECRNTALTADNKTALSHEAAEITRQLASRPLLPPLLQARLAARQDQITTFLNRYPDRP